MRPWSRALSVHQGKGLTPEAAMIGALMEAVESDHAEGFDGLRRRCAFEGLEASQRAAALADFACDRRCAPARDEPMAWVEAKRLLDDSRLWVPFDVVSLDFTRRGDARLDRSSDGNGAHFDREIAVRKALLEVIERDAHSAWKCASIQHRSLDQIDMTAAPYTWFQGLRDVIDAAGLRMATYALAAVVPVPVLLCEITEPDAGPCARRAVFGMACHTSAEEALLGAVLEAVQSRLTMISGVRDDIRLPDPAASPADGLGFALPLPPGLRPKTWEAVASQFAAKPDASATDIARCLANAGYADAAIVDLSRPGGDAFVVKAIVPGLGAGARLRRPAITR